MYVGSPFVANTQTPELKKSCKGSFYHPPPSAQSTAMLGVAFDKERLDVPSKQASPDLFRVIAPVAQHTSRTMTWPSLLSLQGRDGIDEC